MAHVHLQSITVQVMPMDDFPSGYYYFHEFWKVFFLPLCVVCVCVVYVVCVVCVIRG